MKYFIITKKHIQIFIIIFFVIIIGVIASIYAKSTETTEAFSEKDMTDVLEEQLPKEKSDFNLINTIKKLVGFDIKKPETVINEFSPMFSDEMPENTPTALPGQVPSEAPLTKEQSITPTPEATPPTVTEKQISESFKISNQTKYELDINDFIGEPLSFKKDVVVLIVHTHTTECYAPEEGDAVINDNSRSLDTNKNIVKIGETIKNKLTEKGVEVIHDTTVHDYPSYQGAYGRSLATIKNNIEKNEKIAVVLDIHRDAIVKSDGTRIKLATTVNNTKCAQLMIVCGSDGIGLNHPKWQENLNFAVKIQKTACEKYDGLMRPIDLREERFNQHMTTGSLILEVGTTGNTIGEAQLGAELIADVIGDVIISGKE